MMHLVLALVALLGPVAPAQQDLSALYNQGADWTTFLEHVDSQKSTWQQVASQANPPASLVERLRKAGDGLMLLVVADANCSDSAQSVPHIAVLAARAGVGLRIVSKAAAGPALDAHRTPDGRTATPTVIFLRGGKDAGAWIERPEALQTWFLAHGDLSRDVRLSRKTSWYQWDRGDSTLAEIVALAERLPPSEAIAVTRR